MTVPASAPRSSPRAAALGLGFGAAVVMWAVGFAGRLVPSAVPPVVLAVAMIAVLVGAGWRAGRLEGLGPGTGALAGVVASLVNLLILGSLLGGEAPNRIVPSALLWVPGSIAFGAAAAALGAALGARRVPPLPVPDWTAELARVAVLATLCLVAIGGLVTSREAGLAVVDWPNSYGYGMFLYPLSRMTGGIYYEHAHRLFGSLVGLTTLVLAARLLVAERRGWVKGLGAGALGLVIVQGILGGLRVTGHFTWSDDPEVTRPSLLLAMVHGYTGQVFLGVVAAIAAVTSRTWREGAPRAGAADGPASSADRNLALVTVGALLVQLALGVRLRHTGAGVLLHVGMAMVVIALVTAIGARALGLHGRIPVLRRSGAIVLAAGWLQVLLGMAALVAIGMRGDAAAPSGAEVALATVHQTVGAILLGATVVHALACGRLLGARRAPGRSAGEPSAAIPSGSGPAASGRSGTSRSGAMPGATA